MRAETTTRAAPLDPTYAALAIEDATDREQILGLLLRAVRSATRFVALLTVHADELRGRRASAEEDFDVSGVASLRIARGSVPALEAAIAERSATVGPIATGEPFVDGLVEQLGGATHAAFVLPIVGEEEVVALVVAHRGEEPLVAEDVAELVPLADSVRAALHRVLEVRARAATSTKVINEADYELEVTVHDAAGRRAAIAALRAKQDWEALADAVRDFVREGLERGEPDEDEQLELFIDLGQVEADKLDRADRAVEAFQSALSIDATDARALEGLERLFVRHGRWRELVDLIEKRVALSDDPARRIALLQELAKVARQHLEDDEAASAAYERILNWEPTNEVALRELEALYTEREQWEPLATLLLDKASRHKGDERAAVLDQVAKLYEDNIGDVRAAFLVRVTMLRVEPERAGLIDELARLGPIARAWDDVIAEGAALAEELEGNAPRPAARLWHLLASWLRTRGNTADADAALDHAYRLDPDNAELAPELLASLRAGERWQELANLLTQRANAESDLSARSALYSEIAELTERFATPADAVTWYERALADEPEAKPVLAALHRLYRRTEQWAELAELIPRWIEAHDPTRDKAAIAALYIEHGRVLAEHLERADDAVDAYHAALALEPKQRAAFKGIAAVYQATGQTDALLDAREAELDARAPTANDSAALAPGRYGELAAAWHDRGQFDRAIACWRKCLAIDPNDGVAHEGLARALRDAEDWPALAQALRVRLELLAASGTRGDQAAKVALLVELAGVLADHLDDTDGAIAAYRSALATDGEHREALDALATVADRAEQYPIAIDALKRLLERTPAPKARADVFARLGHAYLNANDTTNARGNLQSAIGLDVEHASALEGMGRMHLMDGELVAAGEELIHAARASTTDEDRIRRLVDAAWIFRHRLHDAERARQCLHLILELDPEHADAKQALGELLADTKQWESLWPHLEQEVDKARHSDKPAEQADVYTRAARCALELDKFDIAQDLYGLACELDKSPALQIERAEALFRSRALDAAAAAFQTITLVHGKALEREQLIAIYRRLADIHGTLGRVAQAQLFFTKILELDGFDTGALSDLSELLISRGRYDEAIGHLRTLLGHIDVATRVPYLERIAELYSDKLRNSPKAMSTCVEALELEPGNRRVLQRLLDLQTEAGNWRAAVDTIGRFLDHETDPARRGAYHLAEAEIRRTELKDRAGALDAYERALDDFFARQPLDAAARARGMDAFRIVDELLTADRDWKKLEHAYRRMIKRVPQGDPALLVLWHALGELYRSRLELYDHAIEAFEVAHSLDPHKSAQRAGILAELYARVGRSQQVSEKAAKLVEADPDQSLAYRVVGRAGLDSGRIDEAWCVARALVFMKKANAEEQALYKKYQGQEVAKATGILDEDTWQNVRTADEDRTVSAIFALAWQGPVALRGGPAKSFDLKPKDRLPVEDGTRVIAKIFRHAARVLNVPLPDVYVDPKRSGRLLLANVIERGRLQPAVIVGRDLMTGYRDTELASAVGAMLALLRPAYYLKVALTSVDELEAALGAAVQLVGGKRTGRPEIAELRDQFATEMQKRITRNAGEALHPLVARLPEQVDLARWRNAVDTAAQRAGLLVSGELAAAARMIATESTALGGPRPLQRVHDLVSYSVSPAYFAARAHLGVSVGR